MTASLVPVSPPQIQHPQCYRFLLYNSDTTASTLTSIFYELAREASIISRIRNELDPLIASGQGISNQKLQSLDLLNGVINEALRLHPPAGLSLPRKTPPEGLTIEDTYIPGYMTVWCPQYVIGRSNCPDIVLRIV